ncbi:MAG: TonB-dependent receptor plug domain-containing protein, partial [Methyloversatilis sp.]|nr:TonB-dependent receptor plug domain-containing protein [Methyloversatilis sp.]
MTACRPSKLRLTTLALALAGATSSVWAQETEVKELPTVQIRAPRIITPLPGVVIDEQQTTSNVQSMSGDEIRQSGSVSLTDAMNTQFQSINVNDYAGNPFQQDLNFRGFSASPLIGTPQGLSVYLDGVRINEAFGDVVNWDLIPNIAIQRMDLLPGSNPLFGHNTLGGAISVSTKSGFTSPNVELSALGGAFGRRQYQIAAGANRGPLAGFFALNAFDEDGWRTNSPTSVRQYFGRIDLRVAASEATVTYLKARNTLVGNGLIPDEQWRESPTSVFTSPDENINDLDHVTGRIRLDVSESSSISLQIYRRSLHQNSQGGDVWDDFDQGASANRLGATCPDGFGSPNGALDQNFGVTYPGCAGVAPNGLFNFGRSKQASEGVALQWTHLTESHQIVLGSTFDWNDVDFRQSQMLGFIDSERSVYLDPSREADLGLLPLSQEITRNNLTGSSRTAAFFFSDTWTAAPNLFVTYGARLSYSRVKNEL